MNVIMTLVDWLNADDAAMYPLQRDGVYPMMSWKNLRVADSMDTPNLSTLLWLTLLMVAVPVLVMVS
jgi:hypothetical protein